LIEQILSALIRENCGFPLPGVKMTNFWTLYGWLL